MWATTLRRNVLGVLPPRLSGALDYYFRPWFHDEAVEPFNGQHSRQGICMELLSLLKFRAIIETGTFRGSTTRFLAREFHVPVYTVEAVARYYHYARHRLGRYPLVRLRWGDSRAFLRRLAGDSTVPKDDVFFYLDAHWYEDLPLREEVEIIAGGWHRCVVMIDDFQVPADPDYGYDDYGAGRRLCLEYLGELDRLGFSAFFPSLPARLESGKRRGCVVLGDEAAVALLSGARTLRRHPGHTG
jgi:hypothetical protein